VRAAAQRAFAQWTVKGETQARALRIVERMVGLIPERPGMTLSDDALENIAYTVRVWVDQFAVE